MLVKFIKDILKKFKIFYKIKLFLFTPKSEKIISKFLPECTCIDVGASYFEHSRWRVFLNSKNTNWIAVDPNAKNLDYLKKWHWKSKLKVINRGLSKFGGWINLYITNVDSGSSLKKPIITTSKKIRMTNEFLNYFFPVKIKKIKTKSLKKIIEENDISNPFFIKLDTQGSELDILKGAEKFFKNFIILGVELETSLLSQTNYINANKITEVISFFEKKGYELININVISSNPNPNSKSRNIENFIPNEADVVFLPRPDLIKKLPLNYKLCIIGFLYSYRLFGEIKNLIENNSDIQNLLLKRNIKNLLN